VLIDRDLNVEQAGGFLVQVLPFASEETLSALERNIAALPSMTTMLSSGLTTTAITEKILASIGAARAIISRSARPDTRRSQA